MKLKTVKINNRFKIKLPEHRANRPEWTTEKGWEKPRLNSMHKHIGKGDVVYYVGAELGEFPALLQMWGAEVCLFEPNHSAWPSIRMIWKANNLKRPLGLYACFVGNEYQPEPKNPDKDLFDGNGWLLLDSTSTEPNLRPLDSENDNWPKYVQQDINPAHGFSELHKEKDGLPVMNIDEIVMWQKAPTALVMDVEGSEFEVLKGAEATISEYKPKIWLSLHPEFLVQYWNVYGREVRDWIIDKGYTETLLEYEHECHLFYKPIEANNAVSNAS